MNSISWKKNNKNKILINETFSDIYREKNEKFKKKINQELPLDKMSYDFSGDIVSLKKNDQEIVKSKYINIGVYNKNSNIWYWSWNVPFINKELVPKKELYKFKEYIYDKYNKFKANEVDEYYFYLKNGNFFMQEKDLQKLLNMTAVLIDGVNYIKISRESTDEYILITDLIKVK